MYKLPNNIQDFSYKKIENLSDKSVVVRACLNIATDETGQMTDSTRYEEALGLIKELSISAKSLVITAHLGRPTSRIATLSFKNNIYLALKDDMAESGFEVVLAEELTEIPQKGTRPAKTIYLLDNIRFFTGEDEKDQTIRTNFANELATLGDVFINDAFPDYKASASTYDIVNVLPSYFGPVFMKEVESLGAFNAPKRPFVAILGGAKLSEKLDALNALGEVADKIIIGGAMAYTILKAQGVAIGHSRFEEDKLSVAKEIIEKFGEKLILPVDHMIASAFGFEFPAHIHDDVNIPGEKVAIDIGPKSIESYRSEIASAGSILWNGPMGVFEWDHSSVGTVEIGSAIVANKDAFKLAGGGDSIAAINKFNLTGFDHVSTGGGAMLAFFAYDEFKTIDVIVNSIH